MKQNLGADFRNSFCSSTNLCMELVRRWVSPYTSLSAYQQNRESFKENLETTQKYVWNIKIVINFWWVKPGKGYKMKEPGHITDFFFKGKSDHLYLYHVIANQVIDFWILKGCFRPHSCSGRRGPHLGCNVVPHSVAHRPSLLEVVSLLLRAAVL